MKKTSVKLSEVSIINLMFSVLSQSHLLHIIRACIIYMSSPATQHSSPFRFLSFPQPSQIPFMSPTVRSLSATEIGKFPPPKISPFFTLLLIALGSPPPNNQSTDPFFLSEFFHTLHHPSFNPLLFIPMSFPFHLHPP